MTFCMAVIRFAPMDKPVRVIAYIIAAFLIVAIGGVVFATHLFARAPLTFEPAHTHDAPASLNAQRIAATSSPVIAPITVPPPVAPALATTSPALQSFSGLVSSIWDDRVIIESRQSSVTNAVAPHTIIITPATRIKGGTLADINVGASISGSGTPDATGAIVADSLAIAPPFQ